MPGIIYLIQPAELVGTKRYKIGCSKKSNLDRVKTYKKGTRYLLVAECEEPHKTESSIKTIFNDKFTLIAGKEYYEGEESNMKQEFINIINNYSNEIKEEKYTEQLSNEQISTKETSTEDSNKKENMNTDDNFTFEDLPMVLQVFLERTLIDENGKEYYDNYSLFWTKIDNTNSIQIAQFKKTNAIFYNFDDETVINFTNNFSENEINIIKKHNLHDVDSIIRNDNIDRNEKTRVIQCYKYVTEKYKIRNIEPQNGQTTLTLDNILFVILINHQKGITFTQQPGKKEDYINISNNLNEIKYSRV